MIIDKIKLLFGLLDISAVIDIIVVAYLIYTVITFLRDSRAMLLLKGVALIAVIYAVALLLHLQMVSYIVKLIIQNATLAIIVLLQPELRAMLENMGRSRLNVSQKLFRSESDEERTELLSAISNIVEALRQLQKAQMGALVVFEQKVILDDIVRSGTYVDANADAAVVYNIFFKNAPLHDGAMLVRKGRICAAGCILPLTSKPVSGSLGTRHRAGIGMSESSDAVVVILSEETGHMSVAFEGSLRTFDNAADLSAELVRLLLPDDSASVEANPVLNLFTKARNYVADLFKKGGDGR